MRRDDRKRQCARDPRIGPAQRRSRAHEDDRHNAGGENGRQQQLDVQCDADGHADQQPPSHVAPGRRRQGTQEQPDHRGGHQHVERRRREQMTGHDHESVDADQCRGDRLIAPAGTKLGTGRAANHNHQPGGDSRDQPERPERTADEPVPGSREQRNDGRLVRVAHAGCRPASMKYNSSRWKPYRPPNAARTVVTMTATVTTPPVVTRVRDRVAAAGGGIEGGVESSWASMRGRPSP